LSVEQGVICFVMLYAAMEAELQKRGGLLHRLRTKLTPRQGARAHTHSIMFKNVCERPPGGHMLTTRKPNTTMGPVMRDSTLVAWYPSLYAPRTGGAYDSHHRTAGIAGRTRRRCGGVADRGARAEASDAGDRISRPRIAGAIAAEESVSPRLLARLATSR